MQRVIFVAILALMQSDGQAVEETTVELRPLIEDDFTNDSRHLYQITGDVEWTSGQLTLNKGSRVARTVEAGSWLEVECDLRFPNLEEQHEFRTTLRLSLEGATDSLIVWSRRVDGEGTHHTLAVVDCDPSADPGKQFKEVQRWQLRGLDSGNWRFTYRYGAITIKPPRAKSQRFFAYIHNQEAIIKAIVWSESFTSVSLATLRTSGNAKPKPLSKKQRARAAEAESAEREVYALYQDRKVGEAIRSARDVCDIRKEVLGEENPSYATSLNNLAYLYKTVGEFAKAESLYIQASEIRKRVLGEEHPHYTTNLNNLAGLYKSIGDYSKAEPLYIQARDISKKALGDEHQNYVATLQNLAELYELMGEFSKAEPLFIQRV